MSALLRPKNAKCPISEQKKLKMSYLDTPKTRANAQNLPEARPKTTQNTPKKCAKLERFARQFSRAAHAHFRLFWPVCEKLFNKDIFGARLRAVFTSHFSVRLRALC